MSSPALPLLVSTKLPSLEELNTRLKSLMARLDTYGGLGPNPAYGSPQLMIQQSQFNGWQRKSLQQQIDQTKQQISQLQNPTDQSGVPPAPDAGAIFGPRIEAPKVGFNDLKINLPR